MRLKEFSSLNLKCHQINTKILILFGMPGVGKGTYGVKIKNDFDLVKITPGDLI